MLELEYYYVDYYTRQNYLSETTVPIANQA